MQSQFVPHQILKAAGVAALVATAFSISHADAAANKNDIIRIDGSSTVYPITEAVAEEFQKAKRIKVTVGISGTGGGFKKFCRGETDISEASRPILAKEMEACKAAGIEFIELPVAYDALTVVINPKNTFIKSFTVEELKKLWEPEAQGTIKTWKQVNPSWPDTPVKLFGAGSDSGTFDYFTEAIVGKAKSSRGDFTASEDDNVLVQGVASDIAATGYFGYAYYEENSSRVKAVPIVAKAGAPGVLPSRETVMNGTYQPLSRPLFIYVSANAAKSNPNVKAFIDFYLANSKELVEEVKYVALPANEYAAVNDHWKSQKVGTGFNGEPEVGVKITDLLKRIK
ncbi:phosphate ABC transporter substrate-binding protein, PhoT family [Methylobacillus rhizosphaerae]|uniref:Phosphate-binding protein n=1 Tax=Methylobacillus rhizosphaerae TaxID=551994 RepID=A0A238Z0T2_9PROT|nr:PstS family phosphate ABC transporter substrate-binding protein [Methylobacillus rhizosphaerae]SNR77055.1 phosphate ABC transporter substrate-binding protein, PhoT family [Methylobacillus rhizosphaerae]